MSKPGSHWELAPGPAAGPTGSGVSIGHLTYPIDAQDSAESGLGRMVTATYAIR